MGQPIIREISTAALSPQLTQNGSKRMESVGALVSERDVTKNTDWELAFWRSEMLRRFKTDLLGNLGHDLRSPLSSQLGSLDLVLSGLCESDSEVQEFIGAARQSAQDHLQLLVDCIDLSRYESPVLPLSAHSISLSPALTQVERLLSPIAADRGVRLRWSPGAVDVFADPHGCEQVVLGVAMWSLGQLLHGSLTVTIGGMADGGMTEFEFERESELERKAGGQPHQSLTPENTDVGGHVVLTTTGQFRQNNSDRDALYWDVPCLMLEAMGGRLLQSRDGDRQQTLMVQFPASPAR